jgi:hypothetical protein
MILIRILWIVLISMEVGAFAGPLSIFTSLGTDSIASSGQQLS